MNLVSIETKAAERAARGACLLDEKLPDWAGKIDLHQLDIDSPCACILGQCYGGYRSGIRSLDDQLRAGHHHRVGYGFLVEDTYAADGCHLGPTADAMIEALNEAWSDEVVLRTSSPLPMEAKAAERAARGAKLLDEMVPRWANAIDLSQFAIDSCIDCILGQRFGGYAGGLAQVIPEGPSSASAMYGFEPSCPEVAAVGGKFDKSGFRAYITYLNEAWADEVVARTSQPSPSPVA